MPGPGHRRASPIEQVPIRNEARVSFAAGEYRWTAQVLNHVIFTDPDHEAARDLLATTCDQLGYRAESGPWRDVYLTGAFELRHGGPVCLQGKEAGLFLAFPVGSP